MVWFTLLCGGGETERDGRLPSDFSDFFRVLTAREGGDGFPSNEVNALGFHTGVWEHGIKVQWDESEIHFYYHHLFTDGSGQNYKNRGDGLFGLGITNPFSIPWISGFLYEFLNSRHQSGYGLSDRRPGIDFPDFCDEVNCGHRFGGRDNYYNNSIYRSGLSYMGHSIGSPLFMTQRQLDLYQQGIETYGSGYFVSNRNLAHHVGLMGQVHSSLSYRFLATYVQYHGTYSGFNLGQFWGGIDPANDPEIYFFNPPKHQMYFLLETDWLTPYSEKLLLTTTISADIGQLFNLVGVSLGLTWDLSSHP